MLSGFLEINKIIYKVSIVIVYKLFLNIYENWCIVCYLFWVFFIVYVDIIKVDELFKKVKILCFVIIILSKLDKIILVVNVIWG